MVQSSSLPVGLVHSGRRRPELLLLEPDGHGAAVELVLRIDFDAAKLVHMGLFDTCHNQAQSYVSA